MNDPLDVPLLLSDRLLLRPFAARDLPFLISLYGDPAVMRFYGTGKTLDRPQVETILQHHKESRYHDYWAWALTLRTEGFCFGQITATPLTWNGQECLELCWLVQQPMWGRGYAPEAARVIIAHGLKHLGWQQLIAGAARANRASQQVMRKAGMHWVGEERFAGRARAGGNGGQEGPPRVMYAIARGDWAETRFEAELAIG